MRIRLAPLDVGAIAAIGIWLVFQVTVKDPLARPPLLDELVMLVIGSWVTYRGLKRNGNGNGSNGGRHRAGD